VTVPANAGRVPEPDVAVEAVLIVIRAWKDDGAIKIRLVTSYPGGSTTVTTTNPETALTRIKASFDGIN
jgi:hypothetical protein